MDAIIGHYLPTMHQLTSTDRLILMLVHDAGDDGATVPPLADLCGTSWEYTQARIYIMKRADILRRVSPRHYVLAEPSALSDASMIDTSNLNAAGGEA